MAINTNETTIGTNVPPQATAQAASQATAFTQPQAPQQAQKQYVSLLNADRVSTRLMERESVSAALSKFAAALEEVGREDNVLRLDENWRIITLDGSKHNLGVSALIYVYTYEKIAIGFVMSLAATWRNQVESRSVSIPTLPGQPPQQCDIPLVVGDVWNSSSRYRNVAIDVIEAQYPNFKVGIAGHFIVPAETSELDKLVMRKMLFRAQDAIGGSFESIGVKGIGLAAGLITFSNVNPEEQLSIGVQVKQPVNVNTFGLPNREDIIIDVNVSSQKQKDNIFEERLVNTISHIGGYLDIIDEGPSAPSMIPGQPIMNPNARFAPQFVITKIDSGFKFVTLETLLAGIGATYTLNEEYRWMAALRPDYGVDEDADTKNIGALTTLIPDANSPTGLMAKTATHSSDFNLWDFCNALFKTSQLSVAIDVEESGELTYLTKVFLDSANGKSDATSAIFEACNSLTGGLFGTHFPANEQMFSNMGMRIPQGYYKEAGSDKLQDLRNIDFLTLLNKTDLETVKRWNQSNNTAVDGTLRLDEKIRIINTYYQSNAKITNYAIRLYVNPRFIEALALSMHECANFQREGSIQTLRPQTYGNQSFMSFGFGQQNFTLTQANGGYIPGQSGVRWGTVSQQNFHNGFQYNR